MSNKSAKQQKALEQARSKLEDLTRKDVVSFSFILSEEGVELCGEEQLTVDMMNLLEESGMIEVAQRIRMHGQVLHHRSTRQIKIEKLQDAYDTRLPPTLYPLQNMKDFDLLRSLLNDVMKVEGLGRLWQPGDNPPESVQHWWGQLGLVQNVQKQGHTERVDGVGQEQVHGAQEERHGVLQAEAHKLLQVARGGGIGEQVQHADVDGGDRAGQGGQIGQAGG